MKMKLLALACIATSAGLTAQSTDYCLTVEAHAIDGVEGLTTYRFYVDAVNATDFVGAVYGDANEPLVIHTSTGFYNDDLGSTTADGINPAIFAAVPSAEFDSWVTVGSESTPTPPAIAVTAIESPFQPWIQHFAATGADNGTDVYMDDSTGGIWFVISGASNGIPNATTMRVLVMQMSIPNGEDVWGTLNFQIFVNGDPTQMETRSCDFNGAGTFCPGDQVGVNEAVDHSTWSVFPTAGTGHLQVEGWGSSMDLQLLDARGRLAKSMPSESWNGMRTIDFSGVEVGWYTLVATAAERREVRRIYIEQ